ncbi:MAG: elongation factor G [Anaerolineaceae bacterium]|nr:elongation factor G [Anaerolineaceae bacterium]
MKEYATESIFNVALVSHSSSGKTMLSEAFLHASGTTTRLGRIEDGTTTSDYDEEEIRRGISLYSTVIAIEYKDKKINILDTPGYNDFIGEMISALSVADSACLLIDAVAGLEVGTEQAWKYCDKFKLPRALIINKMDRDNADFEKALNTVKEFSDTRLIPVQIPWGEKQDFHGVIDLLRMKAYKGKENVEVDIPAEYLEAAETAHMELIEAAAEGEDELLEKYLETGELSSEEIQRGLRSAIHSHTFIPVFVSSATAEIGMLPILDAIITLMPSASEIPAIVAHGVEGDEELTASDIGPLCAYVWNTTADPFVGKQTYFRIYSGTINADSRIQNHTKNIEERIGNIYVARGKETISVKTLHSGDIGAVPKLSETSTGNVLGDKTHPITLPLPEFPNALYQVAVFPKTQADSTKISPTLTRLCEEDMTLSWHNEPTTIQTILQGMGDQHIDVAIRRAQAKFQLGLDVGIPKVPYRETITKKATSMYRHKKQSGGAGQFGEVHLNILPNEESEFEFFNKIFGGAISSSYMTAIEKGIRNSMKGGVVAGYPASGFSIEIIDGKEHAVDSKPIAFEIAGREAFKIAFKSASPVLKEPIMDVKITVPEENMGDALGDLNTRRARVQGMDSDGGYSIISANVPLAEMQRYTTLLRSITGGRGYFTMKLSHYEIVPQHITEEIIAEKQREDADDS